jgi:hypothetical protein
MCSADSGEGCSHDEIANMDNPYNSQKEDCSDTRHNYCGSTPTSQNEGTYMDNNRGHEQGWISRFFVREETSLTPEVLAAMNVCTAQERYWNEELVACTDAPDCRFDACEGCLDEDSCGENSCMWDVSTNVCYWRCLFRQTHPFVQPKSAWVSYNPTEAAAPNFSALDTLESCRDPQGMLHLKIVWPNHPTPNYNEWKQSSNPITHPSVAGYEPVDIQFTTDSWGGLELSGRREALMDGSIGDSWWYAVGASEEYQGGYPGGSFIADVVELYVACGK